MNRADFDKLSILNQINHINKLLVNGESLRSISASLRISKTTIRDRFKRLGYTFDSSKRQYIKTEHEDTPKVIQTSTNKTSKSNTFVKKSTKNKSLQEFESMKSDLIELINTKEDLFTMLENYEGNTNIINTSQLDINTIPSVFKTNIVNKSMKVYKPIFDEFTAICNKYKGIKKQDLISLALYEFISKYK